MPESDPKSGDNELPDVAIRFGALVKRHITRLALTYELAGHMVWPESKDGDSRKSHISKYVNGKMGVPTERTVARFRDGLDIPQDEIDACFGTTAIEIAGGYTRTEHEARLRAREATLRAELDGKHGAERALLEAQIAEAQRKLGDLEADYEKTRADLEEARATLARYDNRFERDKIDAANRALDRGDRTLADALFAEAQASLTAQGEDLLAEAAKLAMQRGRMAEDDIRWGEAAAHYAEAARLRPDWDALFKAGTFAWKSGDYARQAGYMEDLLALSERDFGSEHEKTGIACNEVALAYQMQGRYACAEPLFRRALEIGETTLGTEHPDVATRLNNLALLLRDTGRHDEAEPLFRRALEIGETTLGPEHPSVAIRLNNLAELLRKTGRTEEAEPLHRRALEIDRKALGEDHPDTAIDYNNLALLLEATGCYDNAEPLFRRALEIFEAKLGGEHPHTQTVRGNYERFLKARGGA